MNANKIYHIAQAQDLRAAQSSQSYSCASLTAEGFIHCCLQEQLVGVVQRYYQGVQGLQLLHIDPRKLEAELVYENTVGREELFPHVYGEINLDAVESIAPLHDRSR